MHIARSTLQCELLKQICCFGLEVQRRTTFRGAFAAWARPSRSGVQVGFSLGTQCSLRRTHIRAPTKARLLRGCQAHQHPPFDVSHSQDVGKRCYLQAGARLPSVQRAPQASVAAYRRRPNPRGIAVPRPPAASCHARLGQAAARLRALHATHIDAGLEARDAQRVL